MDSGQDECINVNETVSWTIDPSFNIDDLTTTVMMETTTQALNESTSFEDREDTELTTEDSATSLEGSITPSVPGSDPVTSLFIYQVSSSDLITRSLLATEGILLSPTPTLPDETPTSTSFDPYQPSIIPVTVVSLSTLEVIVTSTPTVEVEVTPSSVTSEMVTPSTPESTATPELPPVEESTTTTTQTTTEEDTTTTTTMMTTTETTTEVLTTTENWAEETTTYDNSEVF